MKGNPTPLRSEYEGVYQISEYADRVQPYTVRSVKTGKVCYFTETADEARDWVRRAVQRAR